MNENPCAKLQKGLLEEMQTWRQRIHAHPETAFEEYRTAELVAKLLGDFGLSVHTGIAETGVVGVLRSGTSKRSIGLRADLDALHLQELNEFSHRSQNDGRMHACGHDGHTAMLLGAAKYLSLHPQFDGTVYFIFQPAEENEGGARRMLEENLLQRFPMDEVYGLHNLPGLPVGSFKVLSGPALASFDTFEIRLAGKGGHAAMPHLSIDPIVVGAQLVMALQTIVSRSLDPIEPAAVSITSLSAGETWNVIPDSAVIRGSVRAFSEETRRSIERRLKSITDGICAAFGAAADIDYQRRYPPTINRAEQTENVRDMVSRVFGAAAIDEEKRPLLASDDFAYFLTERPGCFLLMGNGAGSGGCELHNPRYDFNDSALPWGTTYWIRLVEHLLRPGS